MNRDNHDFHIADRKDGCTVTVSVAKFTKGRVKRPVLYIDVEGNSSGTPTVTIKAPPNELLYGEDEVDALIEGLQLAKTMMKTSVSKVD